VPEDPADRDAVLEGLRAEDGALAVQYGRERAEQTLPGILSAPASPCLRRVRRVAVEIAHRALAEGVARELVRYGRRPRPPIPRCRASPSRRHHRPRRRRHHVRRAHRPVIWQRRSGPDSAEDEGQIHWIPRVLVEIIGERTAASAVDRAA